MGGSSFLNNRSSGSLHDRSDLLLAQIRVGIELRLLGLDGTILAHDDPGFRSGNLLAVLDLIVRKNVVVQGQMHRFAVLAGLLVLDDFHDRQGLVTGLHEQLPDHGQRSQARLFQRAMGRTIALLHGVQRTVLRDNNVLSGTFNHNSLHLQ